jgi:hypothetical protein
MSGGGKEVKKLVLVFAFAVVISMVFLSASHGIGSVKAADEGYNIVQVDRAVTIMYNGIVFVNDSIQIAGSGGTTLPSFLVGLPYIYGSNVLRSLAYDASGAVDVKLNVPLAGCVGFYAVQLTFPQPLDISDGLVHVFNVVFVLSNNLITVSGTNYTLDFPAYPSLTKDVNYCNVTIVLPQGAENATVAVEESVNSSLTFAKSNLPAFTYSPANMTFTLTSDSNLKLFDIDGLNRQVTISGLGEISLADSYYITNKQTTTLSSVNVILPSNASNPMAADQFGGTMPAPTLVDAELNSYQVNFTLPLDSLKATSFTVTCPLASSAYINRQSGGADFNITVPLFQGVNYYAEQASVTVVLPEGARILNQGSPIDTEAYGVTRDIFQDTITINRQNVGLIEEIFPAQNVVQVLYTYNVLWLSFRPTIWVLAISSLVCAVVVVMRRPRAPVAVEVPTFAAKVRPENLRTYVDAYEEKRKVTAEMESLETMVRKGKIPRRRYKVRRKTLETRLATLNRTLTDIGGQLHAAGGKYTDLMRQLEVAETGINEVEANIRSIEARHSRGELSLEAYRKLMADYQHRKERDETAISGILLRLREEIR